jgi:hypothetical protein
MAEYFGCGVVGSVYLDPTNDQAIPKSTQKWICEIDDYRPFPTPVPAKDGSSYLENISANFWGVAVCELPESVYAAIMDRAVLPTVPLDLPVEQLNLPPIDQVAPERATTTLLIAQRPKADRNTRYMDAALSHLRSQSAEVKPEDVVRLSPLADKHFNVLGRYHFTVTDSILRGDLRPLRDPDAPEELLWAAEA